MNTIEGLELAIASADSMIEKCRIITVQHIDEITRLKAELAAAHQEIAALKGDAARYRLLRNAVCTDDETAMVDIFDGTFVGEFPTQDEFDAAIDKAMEGKS